MSESKSIEFVVTRFVQTGDSEGDFINYSLTLEVRKDGEEKEIYQIPVSCSGTLQAVWGLSEEELKCSVYEVARKILLVLLNDKLPQDINSEIDLTSYNAPEIPPKQIHEMPDIIRRSVTVFPETLRGASSLSTSYTKQVSFLGHTIAGLRDAINSRTKLIWGFRLLEVHEERAIEDMALPCETKEEFASRLLTLRNLVAWLNIKEIKKVVKHAGDIDGSINWLEVLLKTQFGSEEIDFIIRKLRCLHNTSLAYPTHQDNERALRAYMELQITWPISDFKLAWERILNTYKNTLAELLTLLNTANVETERIQGKKQIKQLNVQKNQPVSKGKSFILLSILGIVLLISLSMKLVILKNNTSPLESQIKTNCSKIVYDGLELYDQMYQVSGLEKPQFPPKKEEIERLCKNLYMKGTLPFSFLTDGKFHKVTWFEYLRSQVQKIQRAADDLKSLYFAMEPQEVKLLLDIKDGHFVKTISGHEYIYTQLGKLPDTDLSAYANDLTEYFLSIEQLRQHFNIGKHDK